MTKKRFRRRRNNKPSQTEKLYNVLRDQQWHTTKELVRRVGHCFGGAKFKLIQYGHRIEKRPHPTRDRQWQYRLLP